MALLGTISCDQENANNEIEPDDWKIANHLSQALTNKTIGSDTIAIILLNRLAQSRNKWNVVTRTTRFFWNLPKIRNLIEAQSEKFELYTKGSSDGNSTIAYFMSYLKAICCRMLEGRYSSDAMILAETLTAYSKKYLNRNLGDNQNNRYTLPDFRICKFTELTFAVPIVWYVSKLSFSRFFGRKIIWQSIYVAYSRICLIYMHESADELA